MRKERAGPLIRIAASMVLACLAGCASLGVQAPDNFGEKVAGAYTTIGAVRDTGLRLLQAGKIGDEDAQTIQNRADDLRAGVEIARGIHTTSPAGGESRLQAILTTAAVITECMTEREQERPADAEPLPPIAVCIQQKDTPT